MRDVRAIGVNALSLLGAYVAPRVFTVGAVVLAARVLGADVFGVYGSASAFAVILSLLATLGMHPLLVRDLAREPGRAPSLLRAAHLVKAVSSVVMLVALVALGRWAVGLTGDALRAAVLLGLAYAVGAFGENLSAYFQAVERMHVWTEASALYGIVTGALGALLVWLTHSLVWFCTAALAGQVISLAWLLYRAPGTVRTGEPVRGADVARLARALAPFAATFVILSLHYKLDVLLLERWRPSADVGLYTAAYKLIDVFHALVIVGVSALYPRLARSATVERRDGERWAGTRAAELAVLAAVPVAAMAYLAAGPAVDILFGSGYQASGPAVSLLALAMPALALNQLGGYLLGAAHRIGWMAALYTGSLVLKTALDAVLIPRYGAVGAAGAMAGAEMALAVAVAFALRRMAGVALGMPAIAVAAAATLLAVAAAVLGDPRRGIETAIVCGLGIAALYASAAWSSMRARASFDPTIAESPAVAERP